MRVAEVTYDQAAELDPATLHDGQAVQVRFTDLRLAVIGPVPSRCGPPRLLCGELRAEDGWAWAKSIRVAPCTVRGLRLLLNALEGLALGRALRSVGRASSVLAAVVLAFALGVATAEPAAAAPLQESAVRTVTAKLDRYESWPDLAAARDRSLVLVHSSGDRHVAARRVCVVRRSIDNARTWRTVKVFESRSGPRLWACEALTRQADGSLLLVVSRLRGHDDIVYVQFHRSTDHGRTWRKVGTDRPWTDPVTFGNLTQLRDGSLIMPWHGSGWGMVRCDKTAITCAFERHNNGGPTPAEGRIFEVAQSQCRLIMTGRNRERGLLLFRSADCGRSWSRGLATGVGVKSEGGAASQGRLTLLLADRATGKMHVRVSSLEQLYKSPTAWGSARYLFTMPGRIAADRGYPAAVFTGVGRLAYAYYAGDYTPSVRTGRLS